MSWCEKTKTKSGRVKSSSLPKLGLWIGFERRPHEIESTIKYVLFFCNCRQDEELRKEDAELKQRVHELHQDNSEIKRSLRQRDENNTVELQNFVRNSFGFRQMDFNSELEKTINKQIEKYLDGK